MNHRVHAKGLSMNVKKETIRIKGKDTFVNSKYKVEIYIKGKSVLVDAFNLGGQTVIIMGKFIKKALLLDPWLDGCGIGVQSWNQNIENSQLFVDNLKKTGMKADIFTYMQSVTDVLPRQKYYAENDNFAAIPLLSFENWWKKQITQEARNKIRKAKKKGVTVKVVEFNDEFVKGVTDIYNETPIRQGKPFWHYGKSFDTLKKEIASYLDISQFIGAYYNNELIGFIKLINAGKYIKTTQVISKICHRDKAPTNAMLAKAVELCCEKKVPYLVYGQLEYGNKGRDSLSDFKRENGFEKKDVLRYYIPLNLKGIILIKLGLHRGIAALIPHTLLVILLRLRSQWFKTRYSGL